MQGLPWQISGSTVIRESKSLLDIKKFYTVGGRLQADSRFPAKANARFDATDHPVPGDTRVVSIKDGPEFRDNLRAIRCRRQAHLRRPHRSKAPVRLVPDFTEQSFSFSLVSARICWLTVDARPGRRFVERIRLPLQNRFSKSKHDERDHARLLELACAGDRYLR